MAIFQFFGNWKVKIFTTSLIKSWSYEFLSLIDLKGIKKVWIIASAKLFLALKARRLRSFTFLTATNIFNHLRTYPWIFWDCNCKKKKYIYI